MAKITRKQYEYLNDPEFFNDYLELMNSRLVYSNNKIEDEDNSIGQLYDYANVLALKDNYKALKILYGELVQGNDLTEEVIIRVGNTINKHAMYISNGYRKDDTGALLGGKFPIDKPKDISDDLKILLDKYYGEWKDLDIFEREARFNIEFLRIHPFEDGNGRTSRLLLNYNLARQLHAPALMPEGIRDDYFDARNHEDVNWIKRLFEVLSKKEAHAIDNLIEDYEMEKTLENSEIKR